MLYHAALLLYRSAYTVRYLALIAIGWALFRGVNTDIGFASRSHATYGGEPEVVLLGWHVIVLAIGAALASVVMCAVMARPFARLYAREQRLEQEAMLRREAKGGPLFRRLGRRMARRQRKGGQSPEIRP